MGKHKSKRSSTAAKAGRKSVGENQSEDRRTDQSEDQRTEDEEKMNVEDEQNAGTEVEANQQTQQTPTRAPQQTQQTPTRAPQETQQTPAIAPQETQQTPTIATEQTDEATVANQQKKKQKRAHKRAAHRTVVASPPPDRSSQESNQDVASSSEATNQVVGLSFQATNQVVAMSSEAATQELQTTKINVIEQVWKENENIDYLIEIFFSIDDEFDLKAEHKKFLKEYQNVILETIIGSYCKTAIQNTSVDISAITEDVVVERRRQESLNDILKLDNFEMISTINNIIASKFEKKPVRPGSPTKQNRIITRKQISRVTAQTIDRLNCLRMHNQTMDYVNYLLRNESFLLSSSHQSNHQNNHINDINNKFVFPWQIEHFYADESYKSYNQMVTVLDDFLGKAVGEIYNDFHKNKTIDYPPEDIREALGAFNAKYFMYKDSSFVPGSKGIFTTEFFLPQNVALVLPGKIYVGDVEKLSAEERKSAYYTLKRCVYIIGDRTILEPYNYACLMNYTTASVQQDFNVFRVVSKKMFNNYKQNVEYNMGLAYSVTTIKPNSECFLGCEKKNNVFADFSIDDKNYREDLLSSYNAIVEMDKNLFFDRSSGSDIVYSSVQKNTKRYLDQHLSSSSRMVDAFPFQSSATPDLSETENRRGSNEVSDHVVRESRTRSQQESSISTGTSQQVISTPSQQDATPITTPRLCETPSGTQQEAGPSTPKSKKSKPTKRMQQITYYTEFSPPQTRSRRQTGSKSNNLSVRESAQELISFSNKSAKFKINYVGNNKSINIIFSNYYIMDIWMIKNISCRFTDIFIIIGNIVLIKKTILAIKLLYKSVTSLTALVPSDMTHTKFIYFVVNLFKDSDILQLPSSIWHAKSVFKFHYANQNHGDQRSIVVFTKEDRDSFRQDEIAEYKDIDVEDERCIDITFHHLFPLDLGLQATPTPSNVTSAIINSLKLGKDSQVLEYGCGTPHLSIKIGFQVTKDVLAVDIEDIYETIIQQLDRVSNSSPQICQRNMTKVTATSKDDNNKISAWMKKDKEFNYAHPSIKTFFSTPEKSFGSEKSLSSSSQTQSPSATPSSVQDDIEDDIDDDVEDEDFEGML